MTEESMPPVERPATRRGDGEQEHLREDAGLAEGSLADDEPTERLRQDAGLEDREDARSLVEKAKDKLTGR